MLKKWCAIGFCFISLISFLQIQGSQTKALNINFFEGDLPSLHPHLLDGHVRGRAIGRLLFEALTRIDAQGNPELAGAESVYISPDKLQYIFTLRNNRWSDGSPVTAYHYEKAWKKALSPTSNCSRANMLYAIKNAKEAKLGNLPLESVGISAIDEKTLLVELGQPSPFFLELVAQCIYAPLYDPEKQEPSEFNGAFLVKTWKKGDSMQLKPNKHFWDRTHISLKQINIFMIQDISTVYALYQKGDLHMIGSPLCGLPPEIVNELKKTNSLKSHPVDRAFWVYINTTHKHLSSPFIRRALGLAIDRSSITKHILIDGQPLTKPLPAIPLVPPFPIKEDLVQANREFEQGLEELGLTRETFPPLTLTYFPQFKLLAEYLQEAWSKTLGIKITLQGKDWNAVRDDLEKGLFEICGCVNGIISKDPLEPLEWFTNVNSNFSKWVNPLFQEKISIAKQEIDLQKRMQYLSDAEQILIDHMPFIPVSDFPMLFTHTPHLQGYILDSLANIDLSRASFKD